MKIIKYLIEFILIYILFSIFKLIGYKNSSNLGEKLGKTFGPLFRNNEKILNNLKVSNIGKSTEGQSKIIDSMWGNYGRILAEYPFIKCFRMSNLDNRINVKGEEILIELKKRKKKAVFISGHFNNFELMAMKIEKSGVDLAAIYRPLNNFFLNRIMENIRIKYICKKQIKKGKTGTRDIIKLIRQGYSVALMIDQRVSEGIKSDFFNRKAFTTTIPAQLYKKYGLDIIPVNIQRKDKLFFNLTYYKPLQFNKESSIQEITDSLNEILERMILKKPEQWIWSHDRWKQ